MENNQVCEQNEQLLQQMYLKFTEENQRLRDALYNLELQAKDREAEHQRETEQRSHEIAELKHKLSISKTLNNHMMDTEEERRKEESSLTEKIDGLNAEITSLKLKIAALMDEAAISKNTESFVEKILHLEEENSKHISQNAQYERMICEMYELTESLREANRDLKVQLEIKQEEQILLEKVGKSITEEFDAVGEPIGLLETPNFAVETKQQPKICTAEISTQTKNWSNEYTQTEHLTSKRHTMDKSTQTEAGTDIPKQLQTSSNTLPQTQTSKCKCRQVKNSTQKSTQAKTLAHEHESAQLETSASANCNSWWSTCVCGLSFAFKYTLMGIFHAAITTKVYEVANDYYFQQREIPF